MKPKTIKRAFAYALEAGDLVRINHAPEPKVNFDGYVIGVSEDFAAIHLVASDFIALNGYVVFPVREVLSVTKYDVHDAFLERALTLRGIFPSRPRNISLDSFSELLSSIDAHFPLLTIHTGHLKPDQCYVGRVANLTGKSITLREINPAACWKRVEKYKFNDITRIDFGDDYQDALWRVSENEKNLAERAQGKE